MSSMRAGFLSQITNWWLSRYFGTRSSLAQWEMPAVPLSTAKKDLCSCSCACSASPTSQCQLACEPGRTSKVPLSRGGCWTGSHVK